MDTPVDQLPLDQQHLVRTVCTRLQPEFAGTFGPRPSSASSSTRSTGCCPQRGSRFPAAVGRTVRQERLRALARVEGSLRSTTPACCSCACTTPVAHRWPPAGCATWPRPCDGLLGRLRADLRDQPRGGRGDGRGRHRHHRRVPQAVDRRGRPGRRRRDHDGLRRRLPALPGQALRGLGARRPGRQRARWGPFVRDDIRDGWSS